MKQIKKIIKRIIPYHVYVTIQDSVNSIRARKYKGNKYLCPICEGKFSKFLPSGLSYEVIKEKNIIGAGYRENAVCPRCLSYDRERLIYLYLKNEKEFIFKSDIKMLHVAPEKTLRKIFLEHKNIDYLSADLTHPSAKVKMDITNIHLENDTFNVIICNHVLEHIPDDKKAMSELYRVLKTGGFAILQVPLSYTISKTEEDLSIDNDKDRIRLYGQEDHVRLYGADYKDRLEEVGFKVEIIDFVSHLKDEETAQYSLLKEEKIFVAYK